MSESLDWLCETNDRINDSEVKELERNGLIFSIILGLLSIPLIIYICLSY